MRRTVAPHAGAWIEIPTSANVSSKVIVAPHTGAWIEMPYVKQADALA